MSTLARTKLSRSLKRFCKDGTSQIIMYSPGVGTGPSKLDMLTGGAFGEGLDQVSFSNRRSPALARMISI